MSQAGLVNNLVFGVSWGLFTLYFVYFGISVNDTAFLKTLHPGVWGFLQLATGPFSDIVGRKKMIYPGMIMQAIGIWLILLSHDIYFGILIVMSILENYVLIYLGNLHKTKIERILFFFTRNIQDLKIESTFFIKISLSSVFFIPSTSRE